MYRQRPYLVCAVYVLWCTYGYAYMYTVLPNVYLYYYICYYTTDVATLVVSLTVHPDFVLKRAKEDECDTCIRLKMTIADTGISNEEREEAQKGLDRHNSDSRIMRVSMQQAIKEFGEKIIHADSDIGVLDNFNESLRRLPESVDDEMSIISTGGPDRGGKPIVRIQCEDYGGNFCLPWYGS